MSFVTLVAGGLQDPAAVRVSAVTLSQLEQRFANGGDTVFVVNFWATWCKPCVTELPAFDQVSRSFSGKATRVLLVSLDDPKDLDRKVVPFVRQKGLHPEVVLLDEAKPHEWIDRVDPEWSGAIPATLFVHQSSHSRVFFERQFSYDELTDTLTSFIKDLP